MLLPPQHLNTFVEILNEPPLFDNSCSDHGKDDDLEACGRLLEEITENDDDDGGGGSSLYEELARVSFAYWIVSTRARDELPDGAKRNAALKEIRRHYVGEGRDHAKALAALKETIAYRRQYKINAVRSCFCDDDFDDDLPDEAVVAKKYESFVLGDLRRQPMVVRGVDGQSRTIVYKPPRMSAAEGGDGNDPADADEAFLITQIYTAERAIATSEFASKGREERLAVVFNFRDYSRKNSPSTSTVMTLCRVLQRCYPERLGVLVITDPPFWMRAIMNIAWPLLSKATTDKIKVPSGRTAVDGVFRDLAAAAADSSSDDSNSNNSNNGKLEGMLATGDISRVDLTEYTQSRPFYCRFDETSN